MKKLFAICFILSLSQICIASDVLKYNCNVTRSATSQGDSFNCGTVSLTTEDHTSQFLKNCNVAVVSGPASASKGRVLTIGLGTPERDGNGLKESALLTIYVTDAPKDLRLTLFPRPAMRYKSHVYDMECTIFND